MDTDRFCLCVCDKNREKIVLIEIMVQVCFG